MFFRSTVKQAKDTLVKLAFPRSVPRGLFDLTEYQKNHGGITFRINREGNEFVAVSNDFRFGSIVTNGRNEAELDRNIRDAILTAFEIPSSYQKEAALLLG